MENHPHGPVSESAKVRADSVEPLEIAALTRRLVTGDDHAYRQFYHAYYDRLSRYLLVVTAGNEDTMHEALQRTLMRVVKNIRVFPSEEIFWSWLTVLARSSVTDEHRKRRRYLAFLDRFASHTRTEDSSLNDNIGDERLCELLIRNLASLPPDERSLLERKYFEYRSVRDIAELEQVSEKTIESRLVRVRRKLKNAVLTALHNNEANS